MKDKNNEGGPSPPSNHSLNLIEKEQNTITLERVVLTGLVWIPLSKYSIFHDICLP